MGPVLFLLYINDLPRGISEKQCRYIYADDRTLWKTGTDPASIQHGLQSSLIKADHWIPRNKMMPNANKTKQSLIVTKQKISHCANLVLNLFLRGTEITDAINEKLLGVIPDKHLGWTNHIN